MRIPGKTAPLPDAPPRELPSAREEAPGVALSLASCLLGVGPPVSRSVGDIGVADPDPELLEEVFELNMQLQEMRAATQMGEDEPELRRDLMTAKDAFDAKMVETQTELESLWAAWDAGVDANDDAAKTQARDAMVTLLNKRSYLRNLVRDVNEALGL